MSPSRTRLVAVATASALAGGLVVGLAAPASATAGPPVVFVDVSAADGVVRVADVTGVTPTALTPAGIDAYTFASSDDGAVLAVGTASGPHRAQGGAQAAYGLWVADHGQTRIVAASWDTRPAVVADGSWVVWTSTDSASAASVLAFNTSSTASATDHRVRRLCRGCIPTSIPGTSGAASAVPARVGRLDAQLVGGRLRVAVALHSYTANGLLQGTRVMVRDLATSVGVASQAPVLDRSTRYVSAVTRFPGYEVALSTAGDALVVNSAQRSTDPDLTWDDDTLRLDVADLTAPGAALVPTPLAGYYSPRQLAGTWYLHSDATGPTPTTTTTSTSTDLTATPGAATAVPLGDRVDGDHTFGYQPVSSAPAPIGLPIALTASFSGLDTSSATVRLGRRLGLDPYAGYEPVRAAGADGFANAFEHYRSTGASFSDGLLQSSLTGKSGWRVAGTRAGSIAGRPYDVTVAPMRTTWYRWVFPGSANLRSTTTRATRVAVASVVTVTTRRSGTRVLISGGTSRLGGTVRLQRAKGRGWVGVATARITSAGRYSFKARRLVAARYRVVTVGDSYQSVGSSPTVRI